jgi:hypothetical protein
MNEGREREARGIQNSMYADDVKTFPGAFLNVDLDIKSRVDPHVMIDAWNGRMLPQRIPLPGRHWVRLMLATQPKSPADAIRRYAKLVRALPPRARAVWTQASKELDIGVQAGFEHRSAEWVLDPSVVEAIAAMGARVRFTVYSPLLIIDEEARSRRRARAKRSGRRRR